MAAGTSPIFVATPRASFINISTNATTSTDGTGGNVATVFTAGSNGSKIEKVIVRHLGTNGSDSTIRFWINNGSSAGTATNNALVHELTLVASTISQGAASVGQIWYADLILPAGYKLMVAAGTALSADAKVTAFGGDY